MYGNVLIPHRQALDLVGELVKEDYKINTHIFELGYLRPNFVTLENRGINYESDFIKSKKFYLKQDSYESFPIAKKYGRFRIRKIWKSITFLNHSFKNYKIVDFEENTPPVKPTYENVEDWLVHPQKDLKEYPFLDKNNGLMRADVFFIVPTLFTDKRNKNWNSDVYDNDFANTMMESTIKYQSTAW